MSLFIAHSCSICWQCLETFDTDGDNEPFFLLPQL